MREALTRAARSSVPLSAPDDLALLFDLRDGVVHAGFDEVVEERLLVAFIRQVDACLSDLNEPRTPFWDGD